VSYQCVLSSLCVDAEAAAAVTEASVEEQEAAATKIQALFRGIHDRAKVEAMKQEQVRLASVHLARQLHYTIKMTFKYF